MASTTTLRARTGECGFTLIELLVSIAILALVATLLLQGVIGAAGVIRRTDEREEAESAVAAAQIILRDRLERVVPLSAGNPSLPAVDIDGTDQVLDFTAEPPPGAPTDALQHYRLMLASGDLTLYRTSTRSSRTDQRARSVAGWSPTSLLGDVGSIALAYYGAIPSDPRPQWHAVWRQVPAVPQLVRVRLGFRAGDRRVWPDLVVKPGTTLDLACDPDAPQSCKAPA